MRASPAFGVGVSPLVRPGADPVADAVAAEELGFDFVSASDHVHGPPARYEAWTMLSWIAAATSRVRVLTRVLGVPFRNPAVLAKMAETFDRLSGGRLILGLGAGAFEEEFGAVGLGTANRGERIDGLEEALRILRGGWSSERFTFDGRHHRVDGLDLQPKPDHSIPIWLGTHGRRGLELTGRLADGWIPSLNLAMPDVVPAMRARMIAAATAAGRDPASVTCAYNVEVHLGDDEGLAPSVVAGSAATIAERVAGFVALGFTAFNFVVVGADPAGQTERLGREVLPIVREMTPAG